MWQGDRAGGLAGRLPGPPCQLQAPQRARTGAPAGCPAAGATIRNQPRGHRRQTFVLHHLIRGAAIWDCRTAACRRPTCWVPTSAMERLAHDGQYETGCPAPQPPPARATPHSGAAGVLPPRHLTGMGAEILARDVVPHQSVCSARTSSIGEIGTTCLPNVRRSCRRTGNAWTTPRPALDRPRASWRGALRGLPRMLPRVDARGPRGSLYNQCAFPPRQPCSAMRASVKSRCVLAFAAGVHALSTAIQAFLRKRSPASAPDPLDLRRSPPRHWAPVAAEGASGVAGGDPSRALSGQHARR